MILVFNPIAKSIGLALNVGDGILLQWNGTYWYKKQNTSQILLKKMNGYDNRIAVVNYAVGKAGNGLYYDDCQFGVRFRSTAISLCQ